MISGRCSVVLVLLALTSLAFATPDLGLCPGQTCPESNFMFTCNNTVGQIGELTWVILDTGGVQVTNYTVDEDSMLGATDTFGNNNQFMVQRNTNTSTTLWFRANTNYGGYTVQCLDDVDDNVMQCDDLQVTGAPTMPESFTINSANVTRTYVTLTWQTPLNYDCVIDSYVINVNARTYVVSNNSRTYNLSVIFGNEYCPDIYANDTAGRAGVRVMSTPRCINVDVAPAVVIGANMYYYGVGGYVNVTVSWTVPSSNTPAITSYTVRHNGTRMMDMGSGSGSEPEEDVREMQVPAEQTSVTLIGVFRVGGTYFVEVIPYNTFGPGAYTPSIFTIPDAPLRMTGLSVGAIVGIVIGAIVGVVLIAVIVVAVVVAIVCVTKGRSKGSKGTELTKL